MMLVRSNGASLAFDTLAELLLRRKFRYGVQPEGCAILDKKSETILQPRIWEGRGTTEYYYVLSSEVIAVVGVQLWSR